MCDNVYAFNILTIGTFVTIEENEFTFFTLSPSSGVEVFVLQNRLSVKVSVTRFI